MSKWIEENNDHILEGHGAKFVVGFVLYSKQLPPKWTIKQSPFLLDVHKKFSTLSEAKEYCEQRYQELFGKLDEITLLRANLAAVKEERDRMREALKPFDGFPLHKWDGIGDDHVLYGPFTLGHVRKYLSGSCQAILDNSNYPEKPDSCARAALEGVTKKGR